MLPQETPFQIYIRYRCTKSNPNKKVCTNVTTNISAEIWIPKVRVEIVLKNFFNFSLKTSADFKRMLCKFFQNGRELRRDVVDSILEQLLALRRVSWRFADSNHRPAARQADALTTRPLFAGRRKCQFVSIFLVFTVAYVRWPSETWFREF